MLKFLTIYKHELKYHFQSVTAYITMSVFLFLSGYFFYNIFSYYNFLSYQANINPQVSRDINLIDGVMRPLFNNISIVLLLVLPLVTMRLLAEEKKQGTFELLLTYPIRDRDVIFGKFLATVTLFLIMLACTSIYPITLMVFAEPEILPILAGYLGIFLTGFTFISIGLFFSSLTDNQLIAGVSTFGIALFFLIIGWAAPFAGATTSKVLQELSLLKHFESFAKGTIYLHDISYYLLLTAFFIFLTLKSLESTRWRG